MLNSVTIMGRLVRDPELRRTGSGIAVASFTLAVEDDFKDKDGNKRRNTEIVVDNVYFGEGKKDHAQPGQGFAMIEDPDARLPY